MICVFSPFFTAPGPRRKKQTEQFSDFILPFYTFSIPVSAL